MSLLLLLHPQAGTDVRPRLGWPRHADEIKWFIQTYDHLPEQEQDGETDPYR
jgi:hypothetical protein